MSKSNFVPWKIIHLKLDKIPHLSKDLAAGRLYIVLWWHEIPLGHLEISSEQLPISANKLTNLAIQTITQAVKAHHCEKNYAVAESKKPNAPAADACIDFESLKNLLERPLDKLEQLYSNSVNKSVSVVICTRDRTQQLSECLLSLQNLPQPPEEIVVVDNAPSSDATRQLVRQMPRIKYVFEPQPGLDVARNAGIAHSNGDIIAFTDDDVKIHPQWLWRLRQNFQDPKVMAMTGLVLPGELATESQLIFEKFWSFNRGYQTIIFDRHYFEKFQPVGVPVWKIGAGANMAFRREAFEKVGYFDERLDMGAAGCSGDSEIWYRLLAEGLICRYDPTAVVYHYHRRNINSLKKQLHSYMRGHVTALLIQFEKYQHWGNLRRLLLSLPKQYAKLFSKGLIKGFNIRHITLFAEISGCMSGIQFYLQNRPGKVKQSYPVIAKTTSKNNKLEKQNSL
ncbi:MAG TPA: glycosyltransferase [Coleofasciculaceae cyanobacterium]|jgi:GT2 family glycosyltransferase